MKPLCLLLFLLRASLQLQCDKKKVKSHIGGEFTLVCNYDTKRFLFSKKYWCRGDRTTCEILVDSEDVANTKYTHRSRVVDARRRGLFVEVTNLQLDDTGLYWVGIDKIYADIMFSVNVVVTKVPVSKPRVWPLSSLRGRPTCWGKPVAMRCGGAKGTGVQYAWYQRTPQKDFLLKSSSDLWLNCVTVESGSRYYCNASNDVSSEESDILSVQVLMPADSSCIYVIDIQGQPNYDCADRMRTTTAVTPPPTTCQATTEIHPNTRNNTLQINYIYPHFLFCRTWAGVPLWYSLLRWSCLASLLIIICIALRFTKTRHTKRATRKKKMKKKKVKSSQSPHFSL